MSKSIWHRYDEAPKHQDIIMTDTGCWAYRADLLALESELERTRKALDVAKDTLHWYDDNYDSVVARNTLDEIKTALEQKDVKC